MPNRILLGVVISVVVFSGCLYSSYRHDDKIGHVSITVKNTGSRAVHFFEAVMGNYVFSPGGVRPGIHATHIFIDRPITEFVDITFEIDEQPYERRVAVKSLIPEDFRGNITIVFSVDSDTGDVSVSFKQL